jgi:hypothetical protein
MLPCQVVLPSHVADNSKSCQISVFKRSFNDLLFLTPSSSLITGQFMIKRAAVGRKYLGSKPEFARKDSQTYFKVSDSAL